MKRLVQMSVTNLHANRLDLASGQAGIDKRRQWLEETSRRYHDRYPTLEEMWVLMDNVWDDLGCDSRVIDACTSAFYNHPVWLLNGLFIEQHDLSLKNRREFVAWVVVQKPKRIADYGGGFGTLARMIGEACPEAEVEIIEPHPHGLAIQRTMATRNVSYKEKLTGDYDILIATDVFEHIPDPLGLVKATAEHLDQNGKYLIASCFWPVIKCHLPQTFHFRYSWDSSLAAMGLLPRERVGYGRVFFRQGRLSLKPARTIESRSKRIFSWLERLPKPLRYRVARILWCA